MLEKFKFKGKNYIQTDYIIQEVLGIKQDLLYPQNFNEIFKPCKRFKNVICGIKAFCTYRYLHLEI